MTESTRIKADRYVPAHYTMATHYRTDVLKGEKYIMDYLSAVPAIAKYDRERGRSTYEERELERGQLDQALLFSRKIQQQELLSIIAIDEFMISRGWQPISLPEEGWVADRKQYNRIPVRFDVPFPSLDYRNYIGPGHPDDSYRPSAQDRYYDEIALTVMREISRKQGMRETTQSRALSRFLQGQWVRTLEWQAIERLRSNPDVSDMMAKILVSTPED